MDYQEFINCLLAGLQDIYGTDAIITIKKVLKNNGQYYDGLQIVLNAEESGVPIINMDEIYEEYGKDCMKIKDSIEKICELRDNYACVEDVLQFANSLKNWKTVKKNVYPILLSTEWNREFLNMLVSTPLLDLSIAYIIRGDDGKCVKINRTMLKSYGISRQTLHELAIENMQKDGYRFEAMENLLNDMLQETDLGEDMLPLNEFQNRKMYVLTNTERLYGAAGILDKKLIRDFAGNRNFFILPSSLHETIFVPDDNVVDSEEMNKMVAEINEAIVTKEEWLSDHSYYYDFQKDEIRMCA